MAMAGPWIAEGWSVIAGRLPGRTGSCRKLAGSLPAAARLAKVG